MKGNQWVIVVLVGSGLLVLALVMRRSAKTASAVANPASATASTTKVSTGTSLWSTIVTTAGNTASSIWGNK